MFRSVVFNVGEIVPQGQFYALLGRFCDVRDLGGDFCSLGILNFWIDYKEKQYLLLWSQSKWCSFDSMVRDKGYKI